MEQWEIAANNHAKKEYGVIDSDIKLAFKAGAEWQEKRYIDVLKAIAKWPGNRTDQQLMTATGPNDASYRGSIVATMRQIAVDVILKYDPYFNPILPEQP
jgi:hypothetical protein